MIMDGMITLGQVVDELQGIANSLDAVASYLGTPELDPDLLRTAFNDMISNERRLWQIKTDLDEIRGSPEALYRLRSILTSSEASFRGIPGVLSGIQTLAQLPSEELSKSDLARNQLVQKLRSSIRLIRADLQETKRVLEKQRG